MLSSLLPGLRELRTPLVVGWTWLTAAWIVLGKYLLHMASIPLVHDIAQLSGLLGQSAIIGVVAFMAYLLGSLIARENRWTVDHAWRVMLGFWRPLDRFWLAVAGRKHEHLRYAYIGQQLLDMIETRAEEFGAKLGATTYRGSIFAPLRLPVSKQKLQVTSDLNELRSNIHVLEQLVRHLLLSTQRTQLETRLLSERREVYDYYDRVKESSDLRSNLSPAVLALGFAFAIRLRIDDQALWSSILALTIAGGTSYALAVRSRDQYYRAIAVLATAVITGLIKSPLMEEWESAIVRIEGGHMSNSLRRSPSDDDEV
jgi:hypothetical protein